MTVHIAKKREGYAEMTRALTRNEGLLFDLEDDIEKVIGEHEQSPALTTEIRF